MKVANLHDTNKNIRNMEDSLLFYATGFLLVMATIFSGGGRGYPLGEMVVELSAIPVLALIFWNRLPVVNKQVYRVPLMLFAALSLLLFLQIIPLPPSIWQALPGRENLSEIARLAGQQDNWRSWSIDPQTTFRAWLSLIVPFAVLLAVMRLNNLQIKWLVALVIIMAAVNLLVGVMQITSGGQSFYAYKNSHMGLPLGFFANRNHIALYLLIALVLSSSLLTAPKTLWAKSENHARLSSNAIIGIMAAGIAFSFGILATNSRTVIALLVPAILFLIYLAIPSKHRKFAFIGSVAGTAIIAAMFVFLARTRQSGIVNQLFERFGQDEDHRFEFWPDSLNALWAYFPFGTGMATFEAAFKPHESLEIVGTHFVNSAHNEYIEIGVESGIFGLILVAVFLLWLGRRIISIVSSKIANREQWIAIHAAFCMVLVSLHSLIDYPTRRLAMMAVCGLLIAVIARSKMAISQPDKTAISKE